MARAISNTLNRLPRALPPGVSRSPFRNYHYIPSESTFRLLESLSSTSPSAESVRRIEDVIYGITIKRYAPAWLPFAPGTSYWVPPQRRGYGVAQLLEKARNIKLLAHEEFMSIASSRGWPCSTFYTEEASSHPVDEE